jgi:hypothetical protein
MDSDRIRTILETSPTIAVLGIHADSFKPASYVPAYLYEQGYRILGVNPAYAGQTMFGEVVVATLAELIVPVDLVDVFRRPEFCADVAREAVAAGAGALWLQLGIRNADARAIAGAAGLDYVEDACTLVVHRQMHQGRP